MDIGGNNYRGAGGPLHVTAGKMTNPLYRAWVEAGRQAGYPVTDDMNGYQQEGVGRMDMTVRAGRRWSAYRAYLKPALKRPNLSLETAALVITSASLKAARSGSLMSGTASAARSARGGK